MPYGLPFVQPQFYRPRENGGGVVGDPFITGYTTLGALRNDFSSGVGLQFTVGSTDITVTHLGRWVISGNSQTHDVVLYDGTTVATDAIGTVTVDTAGQPADAFVYEPLGSPITLTALGTYYLLSIESSGGDQWYNRDGTFPTTTADATLVGASYSFGGTIILDIANGSSYGFPGFLYTL